jgi:hypothetical protein
MDDSLIYNAVCDGHEIGIYFAYFAGINHILTKYGGRYMSRKDSAWFRYWLFSRDSLDGTLRNLYDELIEAGKPHGVFEEWDIFNEMMNFCCANPDPTAFIAELRLTIYPVKDGGAAVTVSEYHPGVVKVCRSMKGRYFRAMKAWCFGNVSPSVLLNNLQTTLSFQEHQIELLPGEYDILEDGMLKPKPRDAVTLVIQNSAQFTRGGKAPEEVDNAVLLAVATPLAPTSFAGKDLSAILSKYSLYHPYQPEGILHMLSRTSALLADDMGLGKTRQAVVAGEILLSYGGNSQMKALVACPASLVLNWQKEIEMVAPQAKVATFGWDPDARWIVTSYDQLGALVPYSGFFKVAFTDEAHLLKEPSAARTRAAFDVAASIPYRYILTGTPILNREAEIHTLLRLAGHPLGNLDVKDFTQQFGGNREFRRILNERIKEWMLRRMKDQVLKLPGKERQLVHATLPDEVMAKYNRIANDSNLTALMKIQKLRFLLERAKIEHVIMDMVRDLAASDKVIIFCEFKANVEYVVEQLAKVGISSVTLTGTDSPRKRQNAVDSFQNDLNIGAFVGTTLAAGVGITLTAANYALVASLPWTAGLLKQAEDRAFRNGQKRVVFVKIPLIDGSIDLDLWQMLRYKNELATDIVSAEEEEKEMTAFAVQWEQRKAA